VLRLVDMVTTQAARVLGTTGHAVKTAAPADPTVTTTTFHRPAQAPT
jgi:hypothetical protein